MLCVSIIPLQFSLESYFELPSAISNSSIFGQPSKALAPILVTVLGIDTDLRFVIPAKA